MCFSAIVWSLPFQLSAKTFHTMFDPLRFGLRSAGIYFPLYLTCPHFHVCTSKLIRSGMCSLLLLFSSTGRCWMNYIKCNPKYYNNNIHEEISMSTILSKDNLIFLVITFKHEPSLSFNNKYHYNQLVTIHTTKLLILYFLNVMY